MSRGGGLYGHAGNELAYRAGAHTDAPVRFFPRLTVTGAASGAPLHVETEDRPEAHVIRVTGEIDLGNVAQLRSALEPAVKNGQSVIMDLSRVTYLDSTTVHAMVKSHRELGQHNCRLIVVGPPFLFKLIRITGLERYLNVVPSMDEATRMLTGGDAPSANPR